MIPPYYGHMNKTERNIIWSIHFTVVILAVAALIMAMCGN